MKNLLLRFCVLTALVFLYSCKTSIISYPSTESSPSKHSDLLDYYLPKSELKIRVPVEKTEIKKGLFDNLINGEKAKVRAHFYKKYGWKPLNDSVDKYALGKNIQFIPLTKPDLNKRYTISYKNAKTLTQAMSINLTKDGVISSGVFAQGNKTFEVVTKSLELGASLAGKVFLGEGVGEEEGAVESSKWFERIKVLDKELTDLVTAQSSIVNIVAPNVSKESIEFRLKLINQRIIDIKKEIFGYQKKTTYWVSLIYESPEKEKTTLLTINKDSGIRVDHAEDSTRYSFLTESAGPKDEKKLVLISQRIDPKLAKNQVSGSDIVNKKKGFLRYNIPAKYQLQLQYDSKPLKVYLNSDDKKGTDLYTMYFPQFGHVGVLPNDFKDNSIVYYEDIGAIKELKYERDAEIDVNSINQLFAAADSSLSLYNSIKESQSSTETDSTETEETEETVIRLIIEEETSPQDSSSSN